jgi:hypothetical protein
MVGINNTADQWWASITPLTNGGSVNNTTDQWWASITPLTNVGQCQ